MKKGYYIHGENCGSSGVMNKIHMQIETFSKHLDIEELQIDNANCSIVKRIYNLLPWASFARDYKKALDYMNAPDFVYIRRMYIDRAYIDFLSAIHKNWPGCKIIVEQPVYPYEKDLRKSPYTFMHYIKELIYRNHYKDDIDRFVTYSDDDEILGVETIRTMNGVNVESISPVNSELAYDEAGIHLLAVATLVPHHGYERIIEGLHNYYQNGGQRKIVFHIVGDGPEKRYYEGLIDRYNLKNNVLLLGAMYGTDLDEMYNIADAGIAAFGSYKEGVDKLCTIKVREYIAKGIPVILGCEDNLFDGEVAKYGLVYKNEPGAIDIERMVDYLDNLYEGKTKEELISSIRDIAYKTVDNEVTLNPVVEYITKG